MFVENKQDLTDNKEYIFKVFGWEEVKKEDYKKVMEQILMIVEASNYESLEWNLEKTIYEAIDVVERNKDRVHFIIENDVSGQLPSSMR